MKEKTVKKGTARKKRLVIAEIGPGDHVYYNDGKDTIPAIVWQVKYYVLINGNFLDGDKLKWVKSTKLELQ